MLPPRYKSRSDQHRVRIDKLAKPKGTYTVVDAQKLLKKEKETSKKKMDVSSVSFFRQNKHNSAYNLINWCLALFSFSFHV